MQQDSNFVANMISIFKKLEFDRVVDHIAGLAVSESGHQRALHLRPSSDRAIIESELHKVSEAKEMFIADGAIPLDEFKNILPALKKTAVENQALTVTELLEIASTIRISRSMKSYLAKRATQFPLVGEFHRQLFGDKLVEYHINEALDERGFVKDTASKELREIRRSIVSASDELRKRLESILRQVSEREFLQEEIITTRDGRLVIPIKTEYKHRIPGFIHSTSASGATVFIEPAESLDLNNALLELQLREQREIHRILSDLTKQVADIREPLENAFSALTELDAIIARAKYSIEIIGNPPVVASAPKIKLVNARHPILLRHMKREDVVPLTIELGQDTRTLIITGPNAGGKTVAMKTVGLLVLCTQAGIHIPAASDSEVFPFQNVFVDIGDDQSIENDLSTFSSHLLSLKQILENAGGSSLVLLDEIGAGTDPSEGGALAVGTLQALTNRQAITIATTHHGMLKAFAHETRGIGNASMEFDQESLRPTYKFRSGIPGSSYAFELAERLGIPRKLLEKARENIGKEKARLEALLIELERQSQEYRTQLFEVKNEKAKLESLVASYEQKTTQLKRELGTMRKKAVDEAKDIVEQTHSKVERLVQEIRESGAKTEIVRASRQVLNQLDKELQKMSIEESSSSADSEPIGKGDVVRFKNGRERGEVLEIKGRQAVVLSGDVRMRIALKDLHKETVKHDNLSHLASIIKSPDAANEIDLRGLFGDEAIAQVQSFLDNAYAAGLNRVDIIHGKGTGALRKRISEFLKTYPHVASFRLGEWNEGGEGVTVAELN
jgi:DNA mismatch repair protein MutS2